jgi:hypothetical protein
MDLEDFFAMILRPDPYIYIYILIERNMKNSTGLGMNTI